MFKGRMRKLVMTAARNGYFFVLDRVTGEHLLTSKYGSATNWVKELDDEGRPMRDPGQGRDDRRRARLADRRRHDQLGAARLTRRTPACSTCRSETAITSST